MGSTSSPGAVFRLWGLTLSATSDALVLGGGLKRQLAPWLARGKEGGVKFVYMGVGQNQWDPILVGW